MKTESGAGGGPAAGATFVLVWVFVVFGIWVFGGRLNRFSLHSWRQPGKRRDIFCGSSGAVGVWPAEFFGCCGGARLFVCLRFVV